MLIITSFFVFFCDLITLIVIIINKKSKNHVIKSHKKAFKKGIILIEIKFHKRKENNYVYYYNYKR